MKRTWLTTARTERNLTHQELADMAGISRSYYTQIESGLRNPSVEVAKKIADVLGFKWTIFF
ncbi:putative HTH-type transcriptional regulator YqaF [Collibacillus ludicampi]|uniref:HTH-type transcriptional regulator YqaF n=1 Tax=Collibacillus ludicampi TaxID=2771369 RepID=A0AAV4LGM9_9BACL|nr:putative HTH-type transcriptional regulator YqaF [Collibacillus ludicampi]